MRATRGPLRASLGNTLYNPNDRSPGSGFLCLSGYGPNLPTLDTDRNLEPRLDLLGSHL